MYLLANICFTDFMMCCEKVEERLTSCTVLPSIYNADTTFKLLFRTRGFSKLTKTCLINLIVTDCLITTQQDRIKTNSGMEFRCYAVLPPIINIKHFMGNSNSQYLLLIVSVIHTRNFQFPRKSQQIIAALSLKPKQGKQTKLIGSYSTSKCYKYFYLKLQKPFKQYSLF